MESMEVLEILTQHLVDLKYPNIENLEPGDIADLISPENKLNLIEWSLNSIGITILSEDDEKRTKMGNFLYENGLCLLKEKVPFIQNELSPEKEFNIFLRTFNLIKIIKSDDISQEPEEFFSIKEDDVTQESKEFSLENSNGNLQSEAISLEKNDVTQDTDGFSFKKLQEILNLKVNLFPSDTNKNEDKTEKVDDVDYASKINELQIEINQLLERKSRRDDIIKVEVLENYDFEEQKKSIEAFKMNCITLPKIEQKACSPEFDEAIRSNAANISNLVEYVRNKKKTIKVSEDIHDYENDTTIIDWMDAISELCKQLIKEEEND